MAAPKTRWLFISLSLVGLVIIVGLYWLVFTAWSGEEAATPVRETPESILASQIDPEPARRAVSATGVLAQQIQRYRTQVGTYPQALSEIVGPASSAPPDADWRGPYLQNEDLAKDPWGRRYQYRSPGSHNVDAYDLWSMGPDGLSGTDDDIGNW
jgi:type II secretion system protein G